MSPTSTPAQATVVSLRADCARRQRRTATGGTAKCCPAARPARTAHLHAGAGAQRRTWPLRASVGRRCTVRTASPANMALARSTSATLRSPGTWKSCCGLWVPLWDAGGARCIDAGAGCAGLPHRTRKRQPGKKYAFCWRVRSTLPTLWPQQLASNEFRKPSFQRQGRPKHTWRTLQHCTRSVAKWAACSQHWGAARYRSNVWQLAQAGGAAVCNTDDA